MTIHSDDSHADTFSVPSLPIAILAGGLATRMRPLTQNIPKSLIKVAGKPFLVHQLELLHARGMREIVLCVGHLGEMIQQEIGDGCGYGVRVQYSFDGPQLLGTGGALRRALPLLGDAFLVLYGDSYLECDYAGVARAFLESDKLGLMTVLRNANLWDCSNVLFHAGRIARYDKNARGSDMNHIDYGLGGLRAGAFDGYAPDIKIDLATIYQDLLARDELGGLEVTRRFYEIGSPEGLAETHAYLEAKRKPTL